MKLNARTGILWKPWLPAGGVPPVVVGDALYSSVARTTSAAQERAPALGDDAWGGPVKLGPVHGILYVAANHGGDMNAVNAPRPARSKCSSRLARQGSGPRASPTLLRRSPSAASTPATTDCKSRRLQLRPQGRREPFAPTLLDRRLRSFGPNCRQHPAQPPTVYVGSFDGNITCVHAKIRRDASTLTAGGGSSAPPPRSAALSTVAEFTGTPRPTGST